MLVYYITITVIRVKQAIAYGTVPRHKSEIGHNPKSIYKGGTIMIIEINPSIAVPIFQQIIQQMKYKIASGILQPGDQLLSVRSMASLLRINPNTVSKAYAELERENVVYTKRGLGYFVSDTPVVIKKNEKIRIISELMDHCLSEAFHLDLPWEDVNALFIDRLKAISERSQK